jgi:isopentenyldiphosphate isomerase
VEKRDLYDKDKNVTGKFIYKDDVIPPNYYELVVVIFIENDDGKFLIQRTSLAKGHKLASTGGHPIKGQSSIDGIIMEVKEELGYELSKSDIKYVVTVTRNKHIVDLYYTKQNIDTNDLVLQTSEVESVLWLAREEIEKLIINKEFQKSHGKLFHELIKYLD